MLKRFPRVLLPISIMLGLLLGPALAASADVTGVGVSSVNPTTVNTGADYTINFTTGSSGALSTADNIVITFPTNTLVPGSIPAGTDVTVNGTAITSAATGSGQTLTIPVPAAIADSTAVSVVISNNPIGNPSIPRATYQLDVHTSIEVTDVTSGNYSITASGTSVTVGTVTPNPDTIGNYAAYTIDFDTSANGKLWGQNSQIIVTFAVGTLVHNGAISGVTVGGVGAFSASGNGARVITIVPDSDIANSTSGITISIPVGTDNVRNPTSSGNKTLTVQTSAQPVGTSPTYSIGQSATTVNVTGVTPNYDTIGNPARYTIAFTTSPDGALVGGTSQILVTFPAGTVVPGGAIANVQVNGVAVTSASGAGQVVTVVPAQNLAGSTAVTVLIANGTRPLTNPSTAGVKSLSVSTSVQPAGSTTYSIGQSATTVNVTGITPDYDTISNPSRYTIAFTSSPDGALVGGTSQILVTFPAGTVVPGGAIANVQVNGVAVTSASGAGQVVTVVPAQDLAGSTAVTVLIANGTRPLTNPSTAGVKSLSVSTSVQPAGSTTYSIGQSATPVNVTNVTPSPNTIGNPAAYTVTFNTSPDGVLIANTSEIILTFPAGTGVLGGALPGITINGSGTFSANGSGQTITLRPSVGVAGGVAVSVVIPVGSLTNPLTASATYQVTVSTSPQPVGTSPNYSITTSLNPVVVGTVLVTPNTIGNPASYYIPVTLSSDGALVGGTSSVTLTFPADTVVPNGVGAVPLNFGVTSLNADGNAGLRTVTFTVPGSLAGSAATFISIPVTSNVTNPTTVNTYQLQVHTNVEPVDGPSPTYTITTLVAPVTVGTVVVAPNTIGNYGNYYIPITLNANGALVGSSSVVTVTFPADTNIPNGNVPLNFGVNNVTGTGNSGPRTVFFTVPFSLAGGTATFISIPAGSLVLNPTTIGNYSLQVKTTVQPNNGSSPNYAIGTSLTQMTVGAVTVTPDTIGNYGSYSIPITTSGNGRLVGGSSTLTLIFPGTSLVAPSGGIWTNTITVGGSFATGITTNGVNTINFTVPIDVPAGGSTTIVIPTSLAQQLVRNPTLAGNYQLQVHSSVQPINGLSNPAYSIGVSGTTLVVGTVTPNPATAGNQATYSIKFTPSNDGGLVGGVSLITIQFPVGTTVANGPLTATLDGTAVQYANGNAGLRMVGIIPSVTTPYLPGTGSTEYTISIPLTFLQNPGGGSYQLSVSTTVQPNVGGTSNLYTIGTSVQTLIGLAVVPAPAVVNNPADYTVSFTTSSDGQLNAGSGHIFLTFGGDTQITLPLNGITVNGVAVITATNPAATQLDITTPVLINQSSAVSIFIPSSILRNPTSVNLAYPFSAYTSVQGTPTNITYSIHQSGAQLAVGGVTVSQPYVGDPSNYSIAFTLGADGMLPVTTNRIVVRFPAETLMTGTAGILVNGAPASSVTIDPSGNSITVYPGAPLANNANVTLTIPAADILNPFTSGTYTLRVATTTQREGTSSSYAIGGNPTTVTVNSATPNPTTVNMASSYTIGITTATALRANNARIFVQFPANTTILNGAITGVQVGGNTAAATGISAFRIIQIRPVFDRPTGSFNLTIPSTAVTLNPSIPASTYTLGVSTTAQPLGASPSYTITPATTVLSTLTLTVNPTTAGTNASYTFSFRNGARGRLDAGNSILITFPASTVFNLSPIPAAAIRVNGVQCTTNGILAGSTVTVTVPAGAGIPIPNGPGALIPVVISTAGGINNPNAGFWPWQVRTDAEPTVQNISTWISTTSNIFKPLVTVLPDMIGTPAQYNVVFALGSQGNLTAGIGYIAIVFPLGTILPGSAIPTQISASGNTYPVHTVGSASINPSTRTLFVTPPFDISAGAANKSVTITVNTGFGIHNPGTTGNYQLQVYTNIEQTPITSDPYAIAPSTLSHITQPQIKVLPAFTSISGRYQLNFQLGTYGGLVKDSGFFILQFPSACAPLADVAAGRIRINNVVTSIASTATGLALTITTPVDLSNSAAVELVIESSSGVRTPSLPGTYTLSAATSSEPILVPSTDFTVSQAGWESVLAFPNPLKFEGTTHAHSFTFQFIPERVATLRLYSLTGKLVRTIEKNDTTDRIVWDLKNGTGQEIASGIYLFVITGSNGEKRGKVALLK